MRWVVAAPVGLALALGVALAPPAAAGWQATIIPAPGPVRIVERHDAGALIGAGSGWYRLASDRLALVSASGPPALALPAGALPDTRIVSGQSFARAWLAGPTERYRHAVLGDAIEADALAIEGRDGKRRDVRLGRDSVFEDREPRVAEIGGRERIVVVRSYLDRGAAIAVIDPVVAEIVAETPPIGHANAWRNPAGVADYDGDGTTDIAAVRQPHVVGRLELWSFRNGQLVRTAEVGDTCNHVIGSRALSLSATADFDGDGTPDLAIPGFDRRSLRLIAFAPSVRDIARVPLPARVVTDVALVRHRGRPAILAGLENGQLVLVHDTP